MNRQSWMERTNPTRRLDRRLWCTLVLLAGLLVLHQFLIQPALFRMTSDAPAINVAGRQRMLSQKLAKSALALASAQDPAKSDSRRTELSTTLQTWRDAHVMLRSGKPVTFYGRSTTDAIENSFNEIEPYFQAISTAAESLLTSSDAAVHRVALDSILKNEPEFLTRMHALVGLYEVEAHRHVRQLQNLGLILVSVILVVLLVMQFGVMRPEIKNAGREWEQFEADYELLVESMTDGLVAFDRQGRVKFANRRFGEILGQSSLELAGRPASMFITDRDQTQFEKLLMATHEVAGPVDLQLRCSRGREVDVMISPRRLCDVHGNLQGLLIVVTDVTARRAIERRSQELQTHLAHSDRLKSMGAMAAALAHEINQPLGAISNFAEGCLSRISASLSDPRELIAALRGILRASHRGAEIVRRTKDFARRRPCQLANESVNDLIHEVVELCRPEARRRRVSIELHLAEDLPSIAVDGIQIQQVLTNLVQNAFAALEAVEYFQRRIKLTTRLSSENEIEISVADSGPGLAMDSLDSLFEPFVTTKVNGTGLGLSIAKEIVELHGGRIWNEPDADEGAIIRFTLPINDSARLCSSFEEEIPSPQSAPHKEPTEKPQTHGAGATQALHIAWATSILTTHLAPTVLVQSGSVRITEEANVG